MSHLCPICKSENTIESTYNAQLESIKACTRKLKSLFDASEVIRELTWEIDKKYNLMFKQYFHTSPYLDIHNSIGNLCEDTSHMLFCPTHQDVFFQSLKELQEHLENNQSLYLKLKQVKSLYKEEVKILTFMLVVGQEIIDHQKDLVELMVGLQKTYVLKLLKKQLV